MAVFRLTSPLPVDDADLVGLSAHASGASLLQLPTTIYGFPHESTTRDGPEDTDGLPDVDVGKLAITSGVIADANDVGRIFPVSGTQQYTGMSGGGMFVSRDGIPDVFLGGIANYRLPGNTFYGGGTYLTPQGLKELMDILHAANPNADPNDLPKNFLFASTTDDTLLEGSWRRDVLFGDDHNDSLSGGGGDDSLLGGAGDDLLTGGVGNDTISGGGGDDSVTYHQAGGIVADLRAVAAAPGAISVSDDAEAGSDLLTEIESLTASNQHDIFIMGEPGTQPPSSLRASGSGGLDTIDFGYTSSAVVGTHSWAPDGAPQLDSVGQPTVLSIENVLLSNDDDVVTISGEQFTAGHLQTVVFDGRAGADTFEVSLGSGIAPEVLKGGDGADVFQIDASAWVNSTPNSPGGNTEGGLSGDASAAPTNRGIVIFGGAGTDEISVQGGASIVFASVANLSALDSVDVSKLIGSLSLDDAESPVIVVVNAEQGDIIKANGQTLSGADISFSSENGSAQYVHDYPYNGREIITEAMGTSGPITFAHVYGPGNITNTEEISVQLNISSNDNFQYHFVDSNSVQFDSFISAGPLSIYGLNNGISGISFSQPSTIPDSYYRKTTYTAPNEAALHDGGWEDYYGAIVASGWDPGQFYDGTFDISKTYLQFIAIDPILDNWTVVSDETTTQSHGVPLSGAALTLDPSAFPRNVVIYGTDGADSINVSQTNTEHFGARGDDAFNVVLTGAGPHKFHIVEGASGGTDQITLPDLFTPETLGFERLWGSDSVSVVAGSPSGDVKVYLEDQFAAGEAGIEQFVFASGSVWTKGDLKAAYLERAQTAGDDEIYGFGDADSLPNGAGSDRFVGGAGDDSYTYSPGDGWDTIYEYDQGGSLDRLILGAGISAESTTIDHFSDHVVLTFAGANGEVRLEGQLSGGDAGIEEVVFSNGVVWSKAYLLNPDPGGGGSLTLAGTSAADTLSGGPNDDFIIGGGGDDSLSGDYGDDSFLYGGASEGYDLVNGGAGFDDMRATEHGAVIGVQSLDSIELITSDSFSGVSVLASPDNNILDLTNVILESIEWIDGGEGNDTIIGSASRDVVYGWDGNDSLAGGAGDDDLAGEAGSDTLDGGAGYDTAVFFSNSSDLSFTREADGSVLATPSSGPGEVDRLMGIEGVWFDGDQVWKSIDELAGDYGTEGDDNWIAGTSSDDQLYGLAGNDVLYGAEGNDTIFGGLGEDQANFDGNLSAYTMLREADGSVLVSEIGGSLQVDLLQGIEAVYFAGDDTWSWIIDLVGDYGTSANDQWIGGTDNEDRLFGLAGDDVLRGYGGNDTINGGAGDDEVSYLGSVADFVFTRDSDGSVQVADVVGAEGIDQLVDVEALYFEGSASGHLIEDLVGDYGTSGNDPNIMGTNASNKLFGLGGNDTLNAGGGSDTLEGGVGNDVLTGGSGADHFTFAAGDGHDMISDFDISGGDLIGFSSSLFGDYASVLSAATQVGSDVLISTTSVDSVLIQNLSLGDLDAGSFLFS